MASSQFFSGRYVFSHRIVSYLYLQYRRGVDQQRVIAGLVFNHVCMIAVLRCQGTVLIE